MEYFFIFALRYIKDYNYLDEPLDMKKKKIMSRAMLFILLFGIVSMFSDMTKEIFDSAGIEVVHVPEWTCADNNS